MTLSEINTTKKILHEIASQAYNLGMGLHNAAPPQKDIAKQSQSVQYLLEIALQLQKSSKAAEEISSPDSELLTLVRDTMREDEALRVKYQVGDKFRFIRDRLHALLSYLEEALKEAEAQTEKLRGNIMLEDEALVYVYLYNVHGASFQSWQNMLTPKVFYEYSVNRPIYSEKSYIEALVRSKSDKLQHGYLTIALKQVDILQSASAQQGRKDALGHPLIKVREGALKFDRFIEFTHNEQGYILDEGGMLVKKTNDDYVKRVHPL